MSLGIDRLWFSLKIISFHFQPNEETILPQKCAPQAEELKSTRHDNVPVGKGHFQVKTLLTGVLGIVEGELVELFKLVLVHDLLLQAAELLLELVNGVTTKLRHPSQELLSTELALRLGFELPGNDQHLKKQMTILSISMFGFLFSPLKLLLTSLEVGSRLRSSKNLTTPSIPILSGSLGSWGKIN